MSEEQFKQLLQVITNGFEKINNTRKIECVVGGTLSKPVVVVDALNLRHIADAKSITEASVIMGTNFAYVVECCELKRPSINGYTCRYAQDYHGKGLKNNNG